MSSSVATRIRSTRQGEVLESASLRVLHVIPQVSGRNSDFTFAKRQANSLGQHGVVGEVFYLYPSGDLYRQWRELRRQVRKFRPSVLHAHYGTVTAALCAFGMGVPVVVTFRGSDLNPDNSVGRVRFAISRLLSQFAAARARGIVCVTPELESRLWFGRRKVTVSSGGIDLERYRPMPLQEARRELEWAMDKKIVLFNAGINPKVKRMDLAREAVARARARVANLDMVVMSGEVDPDAVPRMLNAADCLLVTSDSEGSPYVVKEALACNLPIVSVAVGDVPERVAKVTPSRIVARDVEALGAAIVDVVSCGERSNGRETIQDISEEAEALRLRQVYAAAAST